MKLYNLVAENKTILSSRGMGIISLVEELVLESQLLDNIRTKYVGEGKPVSEETFNEISEIADNKPKIITWLVLRVVDKSILEEDLYKFKDYFKYYRQFSRLYPIKDLGQINNKEKVDEFVQKSIQIRERNIKIEDGDKQKFVTPDGIQKLENVGIKYLGIADNYQVFEVPNEAKDNDEAFKVYQDVLAKCAGREQGARIEICTMGGIGHFKQYLTDYPGSSYFVIFNEADPKSPYQIHYESGQFMDKDDQSILK